MRKTLIPVAFGGMLILGNAVWIGAALAQTRVCTVAQEMNHLTKELELTPTEQKKIMPLLLEHRQRIQALFDQHSSTPREALWPQIHAISEDTHHEIEALLTDHQRQLAKAMQARMHSDKRPSS